MGLEPGSQALEPLPGEVSTGMARFCQQRLVKAHVQNAGPREAKEHLQGQDGACSGSSHSQYK